MAITVKHKFVSAIPDAGDTTIVQPSNWNDSHDLVGTVPPANGGTGASTLTGYVMGNGTATMTASATVPSTDITGLGTMSTQNANAIAVTGGTISGVSITGYIPTTEKAVANGVATLDGGGTVPVSQLPAAVLGALSYQGTWNASTNTPTLTSSVGTKGYYYVVNVAGSTNLNGITDWQIGDWAVYNGSAWQKIDNTDLVTSVNGYTGAVNLTYTDVGAFPATSTTGTGNVVLGTGATQAHPTISDYEVFTSTTPPSYAEGRVWFDSGNHTLSQYNDVTNNIVHLGEEVQLKVINNTGSSIPNGSPVYITSISSGQTYPNIALAKADTLATSNVIGLTNGAIANGQAGYVTTIGLLNPANTGTFAVGDVLYLSPYSAGQIMNTLPPTGYPVRLGIVAYSNNPNGAIYITKTNVYSLAANIVGTVAVANGGTGATTLTGYVKGSGTSAMTASSTIPTTDLSGTITNAQLANSAITINGTSTSLGGSISVGTVTSVTGTSPVVSSGGTTPAISMPVATTSVSGYLSSTDWNTFNGKGSGSVTSVALTAPSIFTVTGSPITSSGTLALTYSGTALPILNGGTGQTTANAAFNALAPSQTSNSGKYLTTDGTDTSWATLGSTYSRTSFTATAAQTTFTVSYTVGLIQVYVNGVFLNGADYTATNGTNVVLAVGCNSGDIVEALAFSSFSVASTVSSFSGGTTGLTPNTGTTGNVTLGGTLAVANGGTGVTTSTGSGNLVLSTSPTLVTPILGTPTSGTLTNATGLPLTTGVTGTLAVTNGGTGVTTSTGTGSTVLSTNPVFSNSISTPNTFGFKNRFINGNFQIAQRGTSGTAGNGLPTTTATYPSIDRWFAYYTGAAVTVAQVAGTGNNKNLIQATGAASVTAIGIGQRIEALNCYDLAGQTVTLSANIANSLLTTVTWTAYYAGSSDVWTSSTSIATGTFTVSSTLTNYSAQISIPSAATTGLQVIFSVGAQTSGTFQIGNAQLELGSIATPFDQRPYGIELNLSQRYYYRYSVGQYQGNFITNGFNTTTAYFKIPMPVVLRVNPTLSVSGAGTWYTFPTNFTTFTSITYASGNAYDATFNLTGTGIASGMQMLSNSNATAFSLQFNSEL